MANLYSQKLLDDSKVNDKLIVAYLRSLGKKCKTVDGLADQRDKYDIVVWSKKFGEMHIDTKYTTRPESRLFYETDKHKNSKADYIWYFLKSQNMTSFLIKKDALKKLTDGRYKYQVREDGDMLVDFSINELKKDIDYWQIDMSRVFQRR